MSDRIDDAAAIDALLQELLAPATPNDRFAEVVRTLDTMSSGPGFGQWQSLRPVAARLVAVVRVALEGEYWPDPDRYTTPRWAKRLLPFLGDACREPLRDALFGGLASGRVSVSDTDELLELLVKCQGAADVARILADEPPVPLPPWREGNRVELRAKAAAALGRAWEQAAIALPVLRAALRDLEFSIKYQAAHAFLELLNPSMSLRVGDQIDRSREVEFLVCRMAEDDDFYFLHSTGSIENLPAEIADLCRPDRGMPPEVRRLAATLLGGMPNAAAWVICAEALDVLRAAAAEDPDGATRVAAEAAVEAIHRRGLKYCKLHGRLRQAAEPVVFDPVWLRSEVLGLAREIDATGDSGVMPILADALEEAGCPHDSPLVEHCRSRRSHDPGCWALALVLGRWEPGAPG